MGSMGMTWIEGSNIEVEALVVGGGFSGIYALYKLREAGVDAKLVEASKELGGVWNHNRYPGARVDSEVPYYQFSIPRLYKSWTWSERFPGGEEILRYVDFVAEELQLYDHIAFEQNVVACDFDTHDKVWNIETGTRKTIRCRYLIVAAGSSYKKHFPAFEGLDTYQGVLLHAAAFPKDGYDFTGKRVAVIGQGATGVQITQEVSKQAENLTLYVRTPNTAIAMYQRKLSAGEQRQWMSVYEHLFRLARKSRSGFPYGTLDMSATGIPKAERDAIWEDLWARGGFSFSIAGFRDFLFDQKANDLMYEFWKNKVRARISDPVKAEIFAPTKAPHPIGTKRPSLEQDYYECVDRPNVDAVDLNQTAIRSFDREGIVTTDGKHRKFDAVVLATGYDSITGSFTGMGLRDTNGIDMKEKWKDGVRTYLGMTAPGFPNMFMLYSPQAPTALSNGHTIIEVQGDWVTEAIVKMKTEGVQVIEAQPQAAAKWANDIQEMSAMTLFPLTNSWYMGANVPGKKREMLNYLAGVETYEKVCKEAREQWTGFDIFRSADACQNGNA